jgi:hypothetical protein
MCRICPSLIVTGASATFGDVALGKGRPDGQEFLGKAVQSRRCGACLTVEAHSWLLVAPRGEMP